MCPDDIGMKLHSPTEQASHGKANIRLSPKQSVVLNFSMFYNWKKGLHFLQFCDLPYACAAVFLSAVQIKETKWSEKFY